MPIYEYACSKCGEKTDVLQKMNDPAPAKCEKCGAEGTLARQVSRTSFVLKGGGWYSDLYGSTKKDSGTPASTTASSTGTSGTTSSATTTSTSSTTPAAPTSSTSGGSGSSGGGGTSGGGTGSSGSGSSGSGSSGSGTGGKSAAA
jgi:putative FmdB family regulatory protein